MYILRNKKEDNMRKCPKCKIDKESSDFWKTCSYCKECQKEHWRNRMRKKKDQYSRRRSELWFQNNARLCPQCNNQFIGKKKAYCCTNCCFLHQIEKKENGCWEWTGLLSPQGYGYFTDYDNQKRIRVHRYSFEKYRGKFPANLHVCHKCDNPKCCSPNHLFLGNDKENMQDCKKKGRTAKGNKVARKGEFNGNAIFTTELVIEIRKMCAEGLKDREISEKLGSDKYSVYQINAIRHRRSWKHIP